MSPIVRTVPQPLPIAHVPLHIRGTIVDIYGNQSLTVMTSAPTRTIELVVFVTCFLKYESGMLDYREFFTPISFLNSVRNCSRKRNSTNTSPNQNYTLMMNILNWNVRGTGGPDFRRVFR